MDYESSQWLSQLGTIQKQMHAGLREGIDFGFNKDGGSVKMVEKKLDNRNQVKIKKISMIFHGFYCTLKIPEEKALFFRVV